MRPIEVRDPRLHRSTMTHDQDQITEEHPRDLEIAEKILKPRRDRAERAYDRALTTLWVGNAGAALATLAYITANRHDGTFTRSLLVPLVLFVLGLAVTGISSLIEFESERRAILRIQRANPILDVRSDSDHWPAEKIRSPLDWRTAMALVSGTCFVVGFIFGFVMLARN
jgi:hypothetical protein